MRPLHLKRSLFYFVFFRQLLRITTKHRTPKYPRKARNKSIFYGIEFFRWIDASLDGETIEHCLDLDRHYLSTYTTVDLVAISSELLLDIAFAQDRFKDLPRESSVDQFVNVKED